jgi:nicotinamidase-related amidase
LNADRRPRVATGETLFGYKREHGIMDKTQWIRRSVRNRLTFRSIRLLTLGTLGLVGPAATFAQNAQTSAGKVLMNPADVVILLIDHQTGLFQTVKDISVAELRNNTAVLAKLAAVTKTPVITTASEPDGPNGPLIPEIHELAPHAKFIRRKGEINSWENEDFVKAVKETGRRTLVIAGVWTSVCVAFPALDAKAEGYKVYAVIDASGDPSEMSSRTTLARMTQAGIIPISTNAVISELQRTWNRPDGLEFAKLYAQTAPNYAAAIESYQKAQEVAKPKP